MACPHRLSRRRADDHSTGDEATSPLNSNRGPTERVWGSPANCGVIIVTARIRLEDRAAAHIAEMQARNAAYVADELSQTVPVTV